MLSTAVAVPLSVSAGELGLRLRAGVMVSTGKTQFPPPSYSTAFLRVFLTAVGERGLDLSNFLHQKPAPLPQSETSSPKKQSTFLKWRKSVTPKSSSSKCDQPKLLDKKQSAVEEPVVEKANTGSNSASSSSSSSSSTSTRPDRKRKNTSFWPKSDASPDNVVPDDMTLLQFLALNALDLTAPASDLLLKNRRSNWFQLTGHPDSFAPAGPGTIWKKCQGGDSNEGAVYKALMNDKAKNLVPNYFREVEYQGENFIEMQDLLHEFEDPNVMDIKMGTRTFLESEVTNTKARHDLFEKMIKIDPDAPTVEERNQRAVTKLRYMQFREEQSSTCSLGFRIEAIKLSSAEPVTNELRKIKSRDQVKKTIALFVKSNENVRQKLLARLKEILKTFQQSSYFQTHEVLGSSILFIYDENKVGAWMIDFAKTMPLPNGLKVDHRKSWLQGNHEEGYLRGLENLIAIIEDCEVIDQPTDPQTCQCSVNSSQQ